MNVNSSNITINRWSNTAKKCRFGNLFFGYMGNTPVVCRIVAGSSAYNAMLEKASLPSSRRLPLRDIRDLEAIADFEKEKYIVRRVYGRSATRNNIVPFMGFISGDALGFIFPLVMSCLHTILAFVKKRRLWNIPVQIQRHLVEYTISDRSSRSFMGLSENFRLEIAHDIAVAVRYIHSRDITHGDIKSPAVFIDEDCRAKLHFFALSKDGKISYKKNGKQMATRWAAPEALVKSSFDGKKADIYAMGVVFWQLETLLLPYGSNRSNRVRRWVPKLKQQVKKGIIEYNAHRRIIYSKSCLSKIISYCCKRNPERRRDASRICELIEECICFGR